MGAIPIARAKEVRDDGSIVEIVIWQLEAPLPPSRHRFKYRLYFGVNGVSQVSTTTSVARATIAT
jgi:hypothetical protein